MRTPPFPGALVIACAIGAATLGLGAPAAGAQAVIKIKASSPYAASGFTTTVTVTSSEAGKVTLEQRRLPNVRGSGLCLDEEVSTYTRALKNSARPITAGGTVTYRLQATAFAFFGGDFLPPLPLDLVPAEDTCWNQLSQWKWLDAEFDPSDGGFSAVGETRFVRLY